MRGIIAVLIAFMLTGCLPGVQGVTMPGDLKESTSEFDGSKQLSMEPCATGVMTNSDIRMSLTWRSTLKPGTLILHVSVIGAHSFSGPDNLKLNIDGQVVELPSIDPTTEIVTVPGFYNPYYSRPAYNLSSNRYMVTEEMVNKIISANKTVIRIDLDREFMESIVSGDGKWSVPTNFGKFMSRLQDIKRAA